MALRTKNCVYCKEKATNWGGHVIKEDVYIILAGWCDKHINHENLPLNNIKLNRVNREGYYGEWVPELGCFEPW